MISVFSGPDLISVSVFQQNILKKLPYIKLFYVHFYQGGVILVSHNEQLIQMVAQETWLCGNKTVKRIEGGFQAYKKTLEEEFRRINAI